MYVILSEEQIFKKDTNTKIIRSIQLIQNNQKDRIRCSGVQVTRNINFTQVIIFKHA